MKNKKLIFFGITLLISVVFLLNNASAQVCACNSCSGCSTSLQSSSCTQITLSNNLVTPSGSSVCIWGGTTAFTNKIIDCNNYKITGNWNQDVGIWLYTNQNYNTIKGCTIYGFANGGIKLESNNNNKITNNVLGNTQNSAQLYRNLYGVYIKSGYGMHEIINNTFIYNHYNGIYIYDSPNNIIKNNTVSGSFQDGIKALFSSGSTYSEEISCNKFCGNAALDINVGYDHGYGGNNTCDKPKITTPAWYDTGYGLGCRYSCSSTYSCQSPPVCLGAIPSNAVLCSNDDFNLTQNTTRTSVDTCTTSTKCEYDCNSGYHVNGGVCVVDCTPETNTVFCTRNNQQCGSFTGADNCGTSRTVNCGICTIAGQTCVSGTCQQTTPVCSDYPTQWNSTIKPHTPCSSPFNLCVRDSNSNGKYDQYCLSNNIYNILIN